MISIKWKRGGEGYADSHCGKFHISPEYQGCETPQSFNVDYDLPNGRGALRIAGGDNMRTCKEEATDWLDRLADAKAMDISTVRARALLADLRDYFAGIYDPTPVEPGGATRMSEEAALMSRIASVLK